MRKKRKLGGEVRRGQAIGGGGVERNGLAELRYSLPAGDDGSGCWKVGKDGIMLAVGSSGCWKVGNDGIMVAVG
ncbi:hypothetical protein Pmani_020723 [Petrolisthes manimaculis]|uniref:Uncharacterized protein n=1 Tax=Petrolisthes manimaculis TaxID=1843537 RepID=A0AAE1PG66_9EUCA|nr:hypothetical protein Pmani_020723 [Petrolisthes manimaculis]